MKTVYAAAALALLVNVQPALAADASIDLSELTCKKFTAYNDDNRGLIMMWFEGYHTGEDEPAAIDFGKMVEHLTRILIDCEANPDKKDAGSG
jgi:hypothetical protein